MSDERIPGMILPTREQELELQRNAAIKENDALRQQLAMTHEHLESERRVTYQAIEREHGLKQQLATLRQGMAELLADRDKWKGFARHRIPTHGPCCTCQKCGLSHDDCRCCLDEVAEELEKAQQEIARLNVELELLATLVQMGTKEAQP